MDIGKRETEQGMKLSPEDSFAFECTASLACFGKCCRMELKLTPYDILKIRSKLSIPTGRFLDDFTHSRIDPESGFPLVILNPGKKGKCMFLRSYGCSIYSARPGACRSFPLSRGVNLKDGTSSYYLQQLPGFCLGGRTSRQWTVTQWRDESGLEPYGRWNDFFVGILGKIIKKGAQSIPSAALNMLASICYDFDSTVPNLCRESGRNVPGADDEMMECIAFFAGKTIENV